jgi:hypothetical protein
MLTSFHWQSDNLQHSAPVNEAKLARFESRSYYYLI